MDLADIKAQSRRALHGAMAVAVSWSDGITTLPAEPDKTLLSARWHTRLTQGGDLDGDYAATLEGIDRLVFQQSQLDDLGITLRRGHTITFPKYGVTFELDQKEPGDGPANVYWHVTRA